MANNKEKKETKEVQEKDTQDKIENISLSFEELIKKDDVFIDSRPVKKEIVWKRQDTDGSKQFRFNVFIRRQNFAIFSNFLEHSTNSHQSCKLLVECLAKDEKGKENLLTFEQAKDLHPELAILFLNAIHEVNTKKN